MAYKGMARIPMRRRQYKAPPRRLNNRGALGIMARRGMTGITSRVHAFKRVCQPIAITSFTAGSIPAVTNGTGTGAFNYLNIGSQSLGFILNTLQFGGAMSFALTQCANFADLTQLFDNYRIKKVILRFDYSMNSAPSSSTGAPGVNTVTSQAVPLIHITPDFDDNSLPTTRVDVLQNSYTKTYRLDKSFSMALTPRAQTVVTSGAAGQPSSATAVGGLLAAGTWLDCSSPAIPHFGVKFWIDDFSDCGAALASLRITPTYVLEAKNVV